MKFGTNAFIVHLLNGRQRDLVDPELLVYTETKVIPEYEYNDGAHGPKHAQYVCRRALEFGQQAGLNLNLCFLAAAFHDAMHHVNRKEHEKLSAEYFLNDSFIAERLSQEEMTIVAEAIEDHRSSLKGEPRSIYGKVLSSADRTTDAKVAIARAEKYALQHYPNATLEERMDQAYEYLIGKYGLNGHAKTYFEDEDFEKMKKDLIKILENRAGYQKRYLEACGYSRKTRKKDNI